MSPSDQSEIDQLRRPPDLSLDGKVAWITGASRGLGRDLAFAFAGLGAKVVLTARDRERLLAVAEEIDRSGGEAEVVAGSVTDPEVAASAVARARDRWGRLDALVNNAGISPSFDRPEKLPVDVWSQVLEVNATGTFTCCNAARELMVDSGGGSMVNVTSVHGQVGHARLAAYAASKGAIEMLSRSLAIAWAELDIRVNTVAPGYMETEMTEGLRSSELWSGRLLEGIPLGRFASTSEVVGGIVFLAGPLGRYITGTTLTIDGGWTAK